MSAPAQMPQQAPAPQPAASLEPLALAALMPMHVLVGRTGHILTVGPTVARLRCDLVGQRLLEAFEVRRPGVPADFQALMALAGRRLSLQLRTGPRTAFKGILVPLAEGEGALLNLSFGIGVVEEVARHRLTAGDFAPTDLTVEMLYLVEAKSAAMEESRRLNQKLEGARSAAEEQAVTDALTGLRNRRGMEEALARLIATRARFGLIHMDLDRFKQVNDTMGHAAGDSVLEVVASVLREALRQGDIAARIGGDEFVLILRDITDKARLSAIARRIIRRIEKPVTFAGRDCRISASAGITISTAYRQPEADRMLNDADTALYASKNAGRGRATLFAAKD